MNNTMNETCALILDEVEKAVIGKRQVVEDVLCAFLAGGHVLLEDKPGLAKTVLVKSFSTVLGLDFKRLQFTPDLLPGDITGGYIFNRKSNELELHKGPVFSNVVLADEINRASPKSQSALLECMEEKQVTLEGNTMRLDRPFWVVATQNPIDHESTFPLPAAQLDRFLIRLSMGYPSREDEISILAGREKRHQDQPELTSVLGQAKALELQNAVEEMVIDESLLTYIVDIVQATRVRSQFEAGASPRACLALARLAKARAFMLGRQFVVPDDIKHFVVSCLGHRILLKPELWLNSGETEKHLNIIVNHIKVPVLEEA